MARQVRRNAVVDTTGNGIAQDDFPLTTNHASHLVDVNHQLTDSVGLHLWVMVSDPIAVRPGLPDGERWRVRLDLDLKL